MGTEYESASRERECRHEQQAEHDQPGSPYHVRIIASAQPVINAAGLAVLTTAFGR
jgi:hypothetical protein